VDAGTSRFDGSIGIHDISPDALLEIVSSAGSNLFALSATAGGDGDVFIVTNAGLVGIGTNAPTALLHVKNGNIMFDDGTKTVQIGKDINSYGLFGVTDQATGDVAPDTIVLSAANDNNTNSGLIKINGSGGSFGVDLIGGGFTSGGDLRFITWDGTDSLQILQD